MQIQFEPQVGGEYRARVARSEGWRLPAPSIR